MRYDPGEVIYHGSNAAFVLIVGIGIAFFLYLFAVFFKVAPWW